MTREISLTVWEEVLLRDALDGRIRQLKESGLPRAAEDLEALAGRLRTAPV